MKVIFLTHQNPQGYRIQDYFSYLERHGVRVELRIVPRERGNRYRLFRELPQYDVVYVQRRLLGPLEMTSSPHLISEAKQLIFDPLVFR